MMECSMKNSAMNALNSGYFTNQTIDDVRGEESFRTTYQSLTQDINENDSVKNQFAEEISFWAVKKNQLSNAMEHYRKKWIERQRFAKDMARKATQGRAPMMQKPDLSIFYQIQDLSDDERDHIIQETAREMKDLQERMRDMHQNYASINEEYVAAISSGDTCRHNEKQIRLVHRVTKQAIKFMEIDYQYAENRWVYAQYHQEILAYLETLPTVPDTGHWRNMLSDMQKIQSTIEGLSLKLKNSTVKSKNSFSEKDVKSKIREKVTQEITELDHDLRQSEALKKKDKRKKRRQ